MGGRDPASPWRFHLPSPRQDPFQITRLIVLVLAGGVFMFWLVAWVLTDGGAAGLQPDVLAGSLALVVWAAVALPAFGGALYFGRRAAIEGAQAQTFTIVAHALLEGPALLGGVFFLLLGTTPVVWVALPVYVLGLALTWPSPDWFTDARA